MKNITLITSVINIPNIPFSYIKTRSVFSKKERYEQLKKTITSVREKIQNNKIFLIECSQITQEEREYLQENCDYFINIYDTNDKKLINNIYSKSKSMGEGMITIYALKYLFDNNIEFENLFKLSGRYWLNENFNYIKFVNNISQVYSINNNDNNISTCLYKLNRDDVMKWLEYLLKSENDFINCIGFEIIFGNFIKTVENKEILNDKVGINGYVSVCGSFIDM